MLLPLIAALLYLALTSRILVDAKLNADSTRLHAAVSLRAWGVRLCMDVTPNGGFNRKKMTAQFRILRQYGDLLRAAMRTIRWGQIDLRVCIGAGDAAQTAMLSGVICTGISALLAAAEKLAQSDVRIEPDFAGKRLNGRMRCIFSMTPGDIMFAVAKEAVKKTQREGFSWLSTPLRA